MEPADRRFFSGLFVALCAVCLLAYTFSLAGQSRLPALPLAQPSVPSLIPPPLSCLCGTTRAITRPINVTCPYCRNSFSIQPSATGELTGATTTGVAVKPTAK